MQPKPKPKPNSKPSSRRSSLPKKSKTLRSLKSLRKIGPCDSCLCCSSPVGLTFAALIHVLLASVMLCLSGFSKLGIRPPASVLQSDPAEALVNDLNITRLFVTFLIRNIVSIIGAFAGIVGVCLAFPRWMLIFWIVTLIDPILLCAISTLYTITFKWKSVFLALLWGISAVATILDYWVSAINHRFCSKIFVQRVEEAEAEAERLLSQTSSNC